MTNTGLSLKAIICTQACSDAFDAIFCRLSGRLGSIDLNLSGLSRSSTVKAMGWCCLNRLWLPANGNYIDDSKSRPRKSSIQLLLFRWCSSPIVLLVVDFMRFDYIRQQLPNGLEVDLVELLCVDNKMASQASYTVRNTGIRCGRFHLDDWCPIHASHVPLQIGFDYQILTATLGTRAIEKIQVIRVEPMSIYRNRRYR